MSSAQQDRGLQAVSRVRAVRERDSRLGLQQAIAEQRRHEEALAEIEQSVREHGSRVVTDAGQFVALRASLTALTDAASRRRGEVDQAVVVRSSADAHWQSHKTRLSAVDNLLESRVDERRAVDAHDEARELDEVAGRLWLRRATGGHA
ncbi:flagellar export protein FliJ [Nocardioides psychrotolerans]|uniref:flagellar export protein FliJ n=1 Tax=Nocardioides psychrotolerans TaxID=1005945 RepID=UPI0031381745